MQGAGEVTYTHLKASFALAAINLCSLHKPPLHPSPSVGDA